MRLIAKQALTSGEYGHVVAGEHFEASDRAALKLIARGLAYEAKIPVYERAVVTPEAPEVSARPPFRHLPDIDEGPPALAAVRSATSAVSDVPPQGNTRRRGRPRRKQPDPA